MVHGEHHRGLEGTHKSKKKVVAACGNRSREGKCNTTQPTAAIVDFSSEEVQHPCKDAVLECWSANGLVLGRTIAAGRPGRINMETFLDLGDKTAPVRAAGHVVIKHHSLAAAFCCCSLLINMGWYFSCKLLRRPAGRCASFTFVGIC